nr:retrovirus-related Pol polyprotein from transposon TNT 1-94 [Tanacetum cinerariifolium]
HVPASTVLASHVPASSVPARSVPASNVPAGGVLASSIDSAGFCDPAVSESVPVVLTPDHAANSTLPPSPSLGSSEHSTRFPSPSDLGNHQPTAGIFSSSSYDDDFCADVTNLASSVAADPVATNYVHNQNRTNHTDHLHCFFACFLSQLEPSSVAKALEDLDCVGTMQEEMQQFYNQQVWKLVPLPDGKFAIGTKWILKNKRDARDIMVRNKARLVAQGHRQEEGIDYDEVFAPIARIEAIRLFLSFALYMGFMVYQIDVKSAFLYWEIEKEVYVTQPKGFEDPHNPKHVYRVVKALYGLHQAPRAWYARLSIFLLKHHYKRGTIDKTLFLKKDSRHIILVQVYVDDIIFGSTNKAWCDEFEVLMKGEFEMSDMGELTFFLGLQVKQFPDGIFISQDKYVKDMLKKFYMKSVRTTTTPYEVPKPKSKDEPDDVVNVHLYRSMIGSLMYLTASRPDIMFAISLSGSPHWDAQSLGTGIEGRNKPKGRLTIVSFVYTNFCAGKPPLLVVPVFLLVLLVYAVGLVSTGSCPISTGKGWEAYEQILDFLNRSHIRYALTHRPPIVFDFLVKQFWATATMRTLEAGPSEIIATIDGNEVVVTVSLIRTQLQLNDANGLYEFTLHDVLDGMQEIGYHTDGSLTFYKAKLSPQWRFLILHPHSLTYNFSMFILDGMIGNIWSKRHKSLRYPRFLQMIFAPMLVVPAGGDGADVAAVDTPMRAPTPVREPTPSPVREPTTFREPTPDSPRPLSPPPYPRSEEVSPFTSAKTPSPTRQTSFQEDISEGGSDYVSLPKSDETPPTTATTAAGGAEDSAALTDLSLKFDRCINRVTTLENELGVTKKVLGGDEAAIKAQDIDLEALHKLASTSLGGDTTIEAAYTIHTASQDAHASSDAGPDEAEVPGDSTMPFRHTIPADAQTIPAGSTPIPSSEGVSAGSSMNPADQADVAAPSSTIPATNKGKAPMLGEDLAKKLHTEQEVEFARQQEELVDWLELMAKIATNTTLSKQLLGDDFNEENMNEWLGWTMKQVKALSIAQLKHEFEYIQRTLERSNLLNFKRTTFRPTPTLEAPSAKRARQGVPQDVPAGFFLSAGFWYVVPAGRLRSHSCCWVSTGKHSLCCQ